MTDDFISRSLKLRLQSHLPLLSFTILVSILLSYLALVLPFVVVIACLVTIGGSFLFREKLYDYSIKITVPNNLHVIALWITCLILPLISPRYTEIARDWFQIHPLVIIGAIAGIIHFTYFVGFGVIQFLSIGVKLRPLERGLFSVILSLLITGGVGFIASAIGQFSTLAIPLLLAVSATLLLLYAYKCTKTPSTHPQMKTSLGFLSFVIPMVLLVGAGFYLVNYPLKLVPTIDQWFHFGSALDTQSDLLFDTYPSYYWNSLFDAMILSISPLPPANTYCLLLPLGLLVIPAFYVLVRAICKKDETAFATTIYALFSGFAGVLAILHQVILNASPFFSSVAASAETGDGINGSLSFPLFYLPKSIGLAAVLLCLFVIIKQNSDDEKWRYILLLSATFALGYLWHIAEAMFLVLILPFLMIFVFREKKQQELIAISVLLSFGCIFLLDNIAPYAVYYLSIDRTPSMLVSGLLLGTATSITAIAVLHERISIKDVLHTKLADYAMKSLISVFVLGTTFELVVWILAFPQINATRYEGVVPLFLYPARLGLPLLLALMIISRGSYLKKHRGVQLSALIGFLAFLIGRVSSWIFTTYSITVFWETRVLDLLWPSIAVLAGVAMAAISRNISKTGIDNKAAVRKQLWVIGLLVILFVGFSSKPYEIEVRCQPSYYVAPDEANALSFLQEAAEGYSVAGGDIHLNIVRDFTSARTLDTYSDFLLESQGAVEAASIMRYYTYSKSESAYPRFYVSVDRYNSTLTEYSDSYLISHLLGYLPLVLNTTVDVFQLPFLAPPSRHPSILVCLPRQAIATESVNLLFDMLAASNASYSIAYSDSIPLTSNVTTILSLDESIEPRLFSWLQNGGVLVQVNCSIVDYTSLSPVEYDRIGNSTSQLFVRGTLIPSAFDTNGTNVLYWYMRGGSQLYPLLTSSRRGLGSAMNLNLWPIFSSMAMLKYDDEGRLLWRALPDLWSFLQFDRNTDSVREYLGIALARGSIHLNGIANVSSSSLLFNGKCLVEYLDDDGNIGWSASLENMSVLGDVRFSILSSDMKLNISDFIETAMITSMQNLTLTLSIHDGEETTLSLMTDGEAHSLVLEAGEHVIRLVHSDSVYSLCVRTPEISCDGSTSFDYLYATQPFDVYINRIPVTIMGYTQFRIITAQSIIGITNLTFDGWLVKQDNDMMTKILEVYSGVLSNTLFLPFVSISIATVIILLQREVLNNGEVWILSWLRQKASKGQPKGSKTTE